VFPPPTGTKVSREQVRELDDSFFSSDPLGYFLARVGSLVASADGAKAHFDDGLGAELARLLHRRPEDMARPSGSARELQVGVDALGLRQHAAEALIRLVDAILQLRSGEPGSASVWVTIAEGPTRTIDVLKRISSVPNGLHQDGVFAALVMPAEILSQVPSAPELQAALRTMAAWLEHAEALLTRSDVHLSAAHNKIKHGLAVRPRDDAKISVLTAGPPVQNGTTPVSALDGAIDIFDQPFLEYLGRPPDEGHRKQGLELTWLRLDTPTLLAETTMLATVYGSIFHVAALNHASRSETAGPVPTYPTVPVGPTPDGLLGNSVTGMRFPVTLPPDGRKVDRSPGVGFNGGVFVPLRFDYASGQTITLVEG